MKTITRAEYIAALRSGKYQQTTGKLRDVKEDGTFCYCALGVAVALAELPSNNEEHGWLVVSEDYIADYPERYLGFWIPDVVADMIGLDANT